MAYYGNQYGSTYNNRSYYRRSFKRNRFANTAYKILRRRMAGTTRAPLATRGWYGLGSRRGRDELKYVDDGVANLLPVAGRVTTINGIAEGSGPSARIGRKALMKSILFRCAVHPNNAQSNPDGTIVRILCVYDRQTNSTAPTINDVLASGGITAPMNLNNRERFKILFDIFFTIGAAEWDAGAGNILVAGSPTPRYKAIYKKINKYTIWDDSNDLVADISTGSINIIELSSGNEEVMVGWQSRIRYYDS